MDRQLGSYLISLPERVVRSISALAGGALQGLSEVVLPAWVRKSRLYDAMVSASVRFLAENIGEVEPPKGAKALPHDFLVRRTAGNVVELAGVVAFRASPVWVLAVLADLAGAGRGLINEIADALKKDGLLDPEERFDSVDQLLDGLERTSGRLAEAVNTPPLNIGDLRKEWDAIRADAKSIPVALLPTRERIRSQWEELNAEAATQERSVVELSSVMALSAMRELPRRSLWLSNCLLTGSKHTGRFLAGSLLEHYHSTLKEMHRIGYAAYWRREFGPYLAGALRQFAPAKISTTQKWLGLHKPARDTKDASNPP